MPEKGCADIILPLLYTLDTRDLVTPISLHIKHVTPTYYFNTEVFTFALSDITLSGLVSRFWKRVIGFVRN